MKDFIQTMNGDWVRVSAVSRAVVTSLDPNDFEEGDDTMGYILQGVDGQNLGEVPADNWHKAMEWTPRKAA